MSEEKEHYCNKEAEFAELKTNLSYMIEGQKEMKEMLSELKGLDARMQSYTDRIVLVEGKADKAHARIDNAEKKLDGWGLKDVALGITGTLTVVGGLLLLLQRAGEFL